MKDLKFDLEDITLIPETQTNIESRKECNIFLEFNEHAFLPIMAAPMDTVVDAHNLTDYYDNSIIACLPRGVHKYKQEYSFLEKYIFHSFGLNEIEKDLEWFEILNPKLPIIQYMPSSDDVFYKHPNILIDIANGHMTKLVPLIKKIKLYFPNKIIMVGNIANPATYKILSKAGADFVRISIGSGAGCTTAANVSINYPMGSLIKECHDIKIEENLNTKIVVDGGMKNYSDIIKALALGADFVMAGSIFNKAIESAGYNYLFKIRINNKMANKLWTWDFPIKKKYRGMSTKEVQRHWGKTELVTAEGITKYQKVEYTLSQWTENFKDYLRSAMSYTNSKTLNDFIGNVQYVFITMNALKRFEK
jgi:IMP dehydrogenase/GMP reductase